jgi:hypothetical protein
MCRGRGNHPKRELCWRLRFSLSLSATTSWSHLRCYGRESIQHSAKSEDASKPPSRMRSCSRAHPTARASHLELNIAGHIVHYLFLILCKHERLQNRLYHLDGEEDCEGQYNASTGICCSNPSIERPKHERPTASNSTPGSCIRSMAIPDLPGTPQKQP